MQASKVDFDKIEYRQFAACDIHTGLSFIALLPSRRRLFVSDQSDRTRTKENVSLIHNCRVNDW